MTSTGQRSRLLFRQWDFLDLEDGCKARFIGQSYAGEIVGVDITFVPNRDRFGEIGEVDVYDAEARRGRRALPPVDEATLATMAVAAFQAYAAREGRAI